MSRATSRRAHPRHPLALAVIGCLLLCGMPAVGAEPPESTAGQQTATYMLVPAPLAQTLEQIARLGGRAINADPGLVAGRVASAVTGSLTAAQATAMALRGTGLAVSVSENGSLLVTEALTKVVVVAQRDQAETSFKADRSDTATRSGTDLLDAPQAMTIITGKVLETQQSLSVRDALANVSGVIFAQTPQGTPAISIRGFSDPPGTVNGLLDNSATLTNVFGVERIEVLKGPASILLGANSLGGAVNIVTKKPQADPIRSLTLQYGSYGDATVAGDIAGAFSDDKRLTYRLIAAETRAGTNAAGYDGRKDRFLLPQIRWKDATTDLIVGVSYGKQRAAQPEFTFGNTDGSIRAKPANLVGNPDDGFDTLEKKAFYQFEKEVGSGVTLVSRLQRSVNDLSLHVWQSLAPPSGANGSAPFIGVREETASGTTSGDHYLRIEGDTGPVSHKLSVGVNQSDYRYVRTVWDKSSNMRTQILYPATGSASVFPDLATYLPNVASVATGDSEQLGVYLQDLMTWGDWNLLVNLRRARFASEFTNFTAPSTSTVTRNPTIWSTTPGAGLVYKVTPEVALYGNYAEGFVPQTAIACGIGLAPPMTTTNKEAGVKFDLLGGRLGLTLNAFRLNQSNSLNYNRTLRCYDVREAQITKGVEADVQGQLGAGWNVLMNYAFTTARHAVNQTFVVAGLSKHKMSLWTTYDVQAESFKGLGFGLGMTATSRAPGSTSSTSTFAVPGQAQFDASVFYRRGGWNTTLGVKNLADRLLYSVSRSPAYVPILPGRTVMLTVQRDFN